jgi:hypothetical protein
VVGRRGVVQRDAQEGLVNLDAAVVVDEAGFLNLFMKKFTRERVVPTISGALLERFLAALVAVTVVAVARRTGWPVNSPSPKKSPA